MFFRHRKESFRKEQRPLPELIQAPGSYGGRASASGSLTLEAACIFPLFFCAILAMLYFTDAVTLQVRLINGIRETGRSMAVAAAAKGIAGIEDSEDLGFAGTAISSVYAKQAIQKEAETSAEHILEGGISLLGSSFLENEMIDLKVSGKLKIPVPFFNIRPIRFWQRGVVRAWTGRIPGETGAGEDGNGDGAAFAYVTVNGSVYHKDANCTHIRLSIKQVGVEQVKDLRSADGSKYYPCSCYKHSAQSTVYITREGNRYHSSLECGGLKRSVKKVTMSEAEHLRACSRCGG